MLSKLAVSLILLSNTMDAIGFRVSPDGNPSDMKQAVENAFQTDVKLLPETTDNEESPNEKYYAPSLKNQILGTEEPCTCDYWSRPDIHTLGNTGLGGAIHAVLAPIATKIIDAKAYGGRDIRKLISLQLRSQVEKRNARVIDLCCGVGMSTRALQNAFCDAEFVVGIDTSAEMISMARALTRYEVGVERAISKHLVGVQGFIGSSTLGLSPSQEKCEASYRIGNAENVKIPPLSIDLITIMYGFHEIPSEGRSSIIKEAKRILRRGGTLAILDICPTYEPSSHMLAGEPFVLEYQQNIDRQLATFPGFSTSKRDVIVPGHVNLWLLTSNDFGP